MVVGVTQLAAISSKLLRYLEEQGVTSVELDKDYYWFLEKEEAYRPEVTPANPSLGQLTDDWRELEMISTGERPPVAYALVWLASILRAVGEEVPR